MNLDIQLNVKNCKNLEESFKNYVEMEILEGDNKYSAEDYGLQDAKKGVIFESFPPVLQLQLKRFEYDMLRDTMLKINDRHEFPSTIDLTSYLSENADKSISHIYALHGYIYSFNSLIILICLVVCWSIQEILMVDIIFHSLDQQPKKNGTQATFFFFCRC